MSDDEVNQQCEYIHSFIQEALLKCNGFRIQEGEKLSEELKTYISSIDNCLAQVKQLDPQRTEVIRERILSQ